MTLNINIRISHDGQGQPYGIKYKDLIESEQRTKQTIMATTTEVLDQITGLTTHIKKTGEEARATRVKLDVALEKIDELKKVIEAQPVPQAITDALAAAEAAVQEVDDQVPDAPTEPPAQG